MLFFHTAIYAQPDEHQGHAFREIVEENLIAEAVVEVNAVVAIVNIAELTHHIEVAFKDSAHVFFKFYDLMTHRSHGHQFVFHGQINVTCTHDATLPRNKNTVYVFTTCFSGGFQGTYHVVVMVKRQSTTCAHVAQNQSSAQYLLSFIGGTFVF